MSIPFFTHARLGIRKVRRHLVRLENALDGYGLMLGQDPYTFRYLAARNLEDVPRTPGPKQHVRPVRVSDHLVLLAGGPVAVVDFHELAGQHEGGRTAVDALLPGRSGQAASRRPLLDGPEQPPHYHRTFDIDHLEEGGVPCGEGVGVVFRGERRAVRVSGFIRRHVRWASGGRVGRRKLSGTASAVRPVVLDPPIGLRPSHPSEPGVPEDDPSAPGLLGRNP